MPKTKKTAAKSSKVKTITETFPNSQIVLNYCRNGNLGFSTVYETIDISGLSRKKFAGKITVLFHFIKQTEVCKSLNSGRTATFQIDGRPVISITQKANDYDEQVFTLTRYREDGSKQSTRRYNYNKTKNLILQAFGFIEINEDEDTEEPEGSNVDMKMQTETGNFDDIE